MEVVNDAIASDSKSDMAVKAIRKFYGILELVWNIHEVKIPFD